MYCLNMSQNKEGQQKVREAVAWYKQEHEGEYTVFVAQVALSREASVTDFAEAEGTGNRMLHEMPETMWDFLLDSFTTEEITWFSTKEANHWFVKEYPEFSVARLV